MSYSLVSVILPLFGEEHYDLQRFVEPYARAMAALGIPVELILVIERMDEHSASQPIPESSVSVRCIPASEPGWGSAVRAGLQNAQGDLLSYANRLSTNPENLALILSMAVANPGMVVKATRRFEGHWLRRLGGGLYTAECRQLFDLPYWDINATPKAFPRHFDKLLNLQSNDFLLETEFCVVCRREPYPVLEIPVEFKGDFPRLSIGGWFVDAKLYWDAIRLRSRLSRSY